MFLILFLSLIISVIVEVSKFHFTNAGSYLTEQSIFRAIEIVLISAFLYIFKNSPTIIKNIYQKGNSNTSNLSLQLKNSS